MRSKITQPEKLTAEARSKLEKTVSKQVTVSKEWPAYQPLTLKQSQEEKLKASFKEHISKIPNFGDIANFSELAEQYKAVDNLVSNLIQNLNIEREQAFLLLDKWLVEWQEEHLQRKTFALPSHTLMRLICNMFNGKVEKLSPQEKKLLTKPPQMRTLQEREIIDSIVNSTVQAEKSISYLPNGQIEEEEYFMAIVSENPQVKAIVTTHELADNIQTQVEALAIYLDKTFGAEGLRHFLALIVGLEENGRQGWFDWEVNEHMERLGYSKQQRGGFKADLKQNARDIVRLFGSLYFTITKKKGNKEIIKGKKLFNIPEFERHIDTSFTTAERLRLEASEFWYQYAFDSHQQKSPQYTKLLKKIVKEDHYKHSITIKLAPQFAIAWRMNDTIKLKVKNLMEWCNLDYRSFKEGGDGHRNRRLNDLQSELNYMKSKGYLGNWSSSPDTNFSESENPLDCLVTIVTPSWLQKEIIAIKERQELYIPKPKRITVNKDMEITSNDISKLQNASGLSVSEFAKALGYTRETISRMKNGKRKITLEFLTRLNSVFPNLLETCDLYVSGGHVTPLCEMTLPFSNT